MRINSAKMNHHTPAPNSLRSCALKRMKMMSRQMRVIITAELDRIIENTSKVVHCEMPVDANAKMSIRSRNIVRNAITSIITCGFELFSSMALPLPRANAPVSSEVP